MTTNQVESLTNEQGDISVDMNTKVQFVVSIPVGMRIALENAAREKNEKTIVFARKILADAVDYTLPAGSMRGRKYTDEEERKKAQAARNKSRRELVQALLSQYIENEEDEDEDDEDE